MIRPFIYLEYQIRKDYIITELCKERYATINTCDGRCFIVKKLNDAQQKESEEKERNIKPFEIKLQVEEIRDTWISQKGNTVDKVYGRYYLPNYSLLFIDVQEEPPQV